MPLKKMNTAKALPTRFLIFLREGIVGKYNNKIEHIFRGKPAYDQ